MSQMKPYCFKCGAELDPDTIYCPVCGRLQRSMVVRKVEAGGVDAAQGETRYQEPAPEQADYPGFTDQRYRPQVEQPYQPGIESRYDEPADEQRYQPHDRYHPSDSEFEHRPPEQGPGYADDQTPGAQEGHGRYGGEDEAHHASSAYGQGQGPGYGSDRYPPHPDAHDPAYEQGYEQGYYEPGQGYEQGYEHGYEQEQGYDQAYQHGYEQEQGYDQAYQHGYEQEQGYGREQEYTPQPPGDQGRSYAAQAPAAGGPPAGDHAPRPSPEPPYPAQEDPSTWPPEPVEPPPPPPPPPPRFVPFSGQAATGVRTPSRPSGQGSFQPQYTPPAAGPPAPGGPGTADLAGRHPYPGYQPAAPARPSWTRRLALGVAGLLILFLVGLGLGHLFGSPTTPAGSQSSRFTQLPSQVPSQPQATAPAQAAPSPTAQPTPFPSTAPTVTGSAVWHTVSAQILNGGKCSISRGCEAGGTFRNSGGLGDGLVTFNITDRTHETVYASCTAPLPQTDTGGTATVSCWANSDQLDQLFESDPNAYIYLQVQLGTS
jgi:hypothetical protein